MARRNFDETLLHLLARNSVVGYDKNVPNLEGLAKLVRLLRQPSGAASQMRLLLVVPNTVHHDVAWGRVRLRPATDCGLTAHSVQGGEHEAYRIFKKVFFDECRAFVPFAHGLPGWPHLVEAAAPAAR